MKKLNGIAMAVALVIVMAYGSVAQAAYLATWDAGKDAYYLDLRFHWSHPNGPDVGQTSHLFRYGSRWYQDMIVGEETARTGYGEWSFGLDDGEKIGSLTVKTYVNQASNSSWEHKSYLSTDSTVHSKNWYSSTADQLYYLGDGVDSMVGCTNSSQSAVTSYEKTFDNLDSANVYFLHSMRVFGDNGNWHGIYGIEITATTIPEPGSLVLLVCGGIGFLVRRRRRRS